jgi:hypothetical protein
MMVDQAARPPLRSLARPTSASEISCSRPSVSCSSTRTKSGRSAGAAPSSIAPHPHDRLDGADQRRGHDHDLTAGIEAHQPGQLQVVGRVAMAPVQIGNAADVARTRQPQADPRTAGKGIGAGEQRAGVKT